MRFIVKIIGPTTEDRWTVVAQAKSRLVAAKRFNEWVETHGSDHGVIMYDSKIRLNILTDLRGCTLFF